MEFSVNLDPLTEKINTDHELTDGILYNWLNNLVVHPKQGKIEISTKKENNHVYLSSVNEGHISDSDKTKIFGGGFFTTLRKGGTGLGMSIIKGNVELLGGSVDIKNIIEDDKSKVRFEIYLPQ